MHKKKKVFLQISEGQNFYLRSTREYFAAPKVFSRSRQASDDEESARIASSAAPLSVLLIPSLKEVSNQVILCINLQICMT